PTGCGMLPQGVLGFQYEAERSSTGVTSLAGLPLYLDLIQSSGLTAAIRRHQPAALDQVQVQRNRFASGPMRSARMTSKMHVSVVSDHHQNNPRRRTGLVERRRQERPQQISPEPIGLLRFPPLLDMKALKIGWRWQRKAIASASEPSARTSASLGVNTKAP
ncbi:MAG: hypothetical protein ACLGXA_14925, partial [Acidobacteriota bacterium]